MYFIMANGKLVAYNLSEQTAKDLFSIMKGDVKLLKVIESKED